MRMEWSCRVYPYGKVCGYICSGLHSFLNAPPHIAGDGFALGLGEGGEERSHHFAGHRRSVNVLFLEVDADTERFQLF